MKTKLAIISVACLILILTALVTILSQKAPINEKESTFSEKDFPLEIDLAKKVFTVGEKISFNATITNKSGKDINFSSNGEMPCVFFHSINETLIHVETSERVDQILKANNEIARVFEYEAFETGTYILDIHYRVEVNNIAIHDKIDDIFIEVK